MMKNIFTFLLLAFVLLPAAPSSAGEVFDRVMKDGKIRCGYAMWPPMMFMDVNEGELHGVAHDLTEALGRNLDLEIEWAEEVNWGNIIEGFVTERYDMFCTGMGINAPRSKRMAWAVPHVFSGIFAVVRADEERIQKNSDLNSPDVKISVLEGEAGALAARNHFPKARFVAIPQLAELPQTFEEVVLGKADATVIDLPTFAEYDRANPGKLRILQKDNPVSVLQIALGIPQGDHEFKAMLDAALSEIVNDGTFDMILDRYPETREVFLMLATPYRVPQ